MADFTPQPACFINDITSGFVVQSTFECSKGFFCPNTNVSDPNTLPQICPPTIDCQLTRLAGLACEPQGRYEPVIPAGYYCPTGSFKPLPCSTLSICSEGSTSETYYGGLLFAGIIDIALLLIIIFIRARETKRAGRGLKEKLRSVVHPSGGKGAAEAAPGALEKKQEEGGVVAVNDGANDVDVDVEDDTIDPSDFIDVGRLVQAFKRGLNNQD
ncbi:hypothetical protein HK102_013790, partial [Quaeritorhiza haematococci]